MENTCERTCGTYHPSLKKAGKIISGIVKVVVSAIVIFTIYQQFIK